jgi:thioesterase domain-containing protein
MSMNRNLPSGDVIGEGVASVWGELVAANNAGPRQPLIVATPGFSELARYLGPEQPVFGIIMEWRNLGRLNSRTVIQELASYYLEKIDRLQPHSPYLLAGFAEGGILAFEIAQQIIARGQQVTLLALLDAPRPGPHKTCPWHARLRFHIRKLGGLPPADRPEYLLYRLKHLGRRMVLRHPRLLAFSPWPARPLEVPDARTLDLEVIINGIAILRLIRAYRPIPYPGRITLILGRDSSPQFGLGSGWHELALDGVTVHTVPGEHCDMVNEPLVGTTARIIGEAIGHLE